MADEEQVALLKQGWEVWNTWRQENSDIVPDLTDTNLRGSDLRTTDLRNANLGGANLSGAHLGDAFLRGADLFSMDLITANIFGMELIDTNLGGANLSGAHLRRAHLRRAHLRRANLRDAFLIGADLYGADLYGADLYGANLVRANLSGAKLLDADLRQATLIDSFLDGADLTGAKLWETQRSGWSIEGVTCRRAFWDRDSEEATEYEDDAFERIFAEKPHILLRYKGGMSPVDLAMLPLIIERLQAEHPDSSLHIQSVQDDGSGATVIITVEDLADRSREAFALDIEVMSADLVSVQQRLQQEEQLRLQAEASYRTMVEDVLPRLLDRALPKTEVHVGQITGPTIIEGTSMSKDTYNIHGQASAVGKNAHAHDMTFQQVWNQGGIDLPRLAEELKRLRAAMKEAEGNDDQDEAIGAVAAAEKAAIKGDGPTALQYLKAAGKWTLGVAERIGVAVATEAIKRAM